MYIDYFSIYKKAKCSGCKTFRIPISAFDSDGKCQLPTEKKCVYSFIYRS